MARSLLLLPITLSLLLLSAYAIGEEQQYSHRRLRDAHQCRIQHLSASRPSQRIESEGGVTELWNQNEEQFQCAGVAAMRNIIEPNSLSLPNYSPSPRLVYIQQGKGLLGMSYPGCAEAYHSSGRPSYQIVRGEQQQQRGEQHQKVHRIRQGDIVALPAGVAYWCYNDGDEKLVALSITDLSSQANQLNQMPRSFYLAGGQPKQSAGSIHTRGSQDYNAENILRAFDANIMAEAFDVSMDTVRKMQREDERGFIVKADREAMSMIRPDEEEEEYKNGMEEAYCNLRINQYLDNPREADVYSRQAGRLNSVNMKKLPILRYLEMRDEKGSLYQNSIFAPHWTMNAHTIHYVTRGRGRVQVVGHDGEKVLDARVNEGDMFVVPQYFAVMKQADKNGLEWVSIKTSALPMRSPLVGSTSAIKGMPIQVLTNSYRISKSEAQNLKYNRERHVMLLPPPTTRSS
uniref:Legumin-like protein n=1 Tax=Asarum europaeum TaxID=49456 RepID=Q38697_ASAEU|nr:legumin-like protein [Asarum europaeum]